MRLQIDEHDHHSFGWALLRINDVKVIWRLSSFNGGGRPQVPLRALFQARACTRVILYSTPISTILTSYNPREGEDLHALLRHTDQLGLPEQKIFCSTINR